LYLPESGTRDKARRQAAGVPPGVSFQTKPAIALERVNLNGAVEKPSQRGRSLAS
jgi:SRSO17 transposase